MGQGYEDHLVTQDTNIPDIDRVQKKKIDAQLCSVLWQLVDPKFCTTFKPTKHAINFGIMRKDHT